MPSNYEAWLHESKMRYHFPPMKARQISARKLIRTLLKHAANPYLAFSGGKDSGVILDLALAIKPDIPIVFFDDLWNMPGTERHLRAVEMYYGISILRIRHRDTGIEFKQTFGQAVYHSDPPTVDYVFDDLQTMVSEMGWDGVLLGLRSEESAGRFFALKRPLRNVKYDGIWHCNPIHDWSYREVWAYLSGKRIPEHPAYGALINYGVSVQYARIGPLTAIRSWPYGGLETLRRLWPETYNEFLRDNPCII